MDGRRIVSLATFKRRTPDFIRRLRQGNGPMYLTINGRAELVVQDRRDYEDLLELAERMKTIGAIRQGLAEADSGQTIDFASFRREARRKHDL